MVLSRSPSAQTGRTLKPANKRAHNFFIGISFVIALAIVPQVTQCTVDERVTVRWKNMWAGIDGPNRSQPALPGSVVGEASMPWLVRCGKSPKYLPRSLRGYGGKHKEKRPFWGRFQHANVFRRYLLEVTSECVMACTDKAMRFCTPTFRINLATCAFTVRSSMPRAEPISLFDRPATSISKTSFSRSVKVTRPAGKILPGEDVTRSMNVESTRRGAHTDPWCTMRIACTKSSGVAASST